MLRFSQLLFPFPSLATREIFSRACHHPCFRGFREIPSITSIPPFYTGDRLGLLFPRFLSKKTTTYKRLAVPAFYKTPQKREL